MLKPEILSFINQWIAEFDLGINEIFYLNHENDLVLFCLSNTATGKVVTRLSEEYSDVKSLVEILHKLYDALIHNEDVFVHIFDNRFHPLLAKKILSKFNNEKEAIYSDFFSISDFILNL